MNDDLISRQAAIDVCFRDEVETGYDAANLIAQLPVAKPRKGKWLCSDDMYETAICSCCGWDSEEAWENIRNGLNTARTSERRWRISMSILIKGMEMPNDCIDCFAETYNECMATGKIVNSLGRPDWCPLVDVPKHGRLIDAGALTELVETEFRNWEEDYDASQFLGDIEDAPTIIEAEE